MNNSPHRRPERLHFVTGTLAQHALSEQLIPLARKVGFEYTIGVMPITVAALMTPRWLLRHLQLPPETDAVVLPGYCHDPHGEVAAALPCEVRHGPKDLRELPDYFGQPSPRDLSPYSIEIIAEINHAPRQSVEATLQAAGKLIADGADRIDVGCDPGSRWSEVGVAVGELVQRGYRVSIDSFDTWEVAEACRAGADLVLSVNSSNCEAAADWGAEVVAIPDTPSDLASLDRTLELLARHDVRLRIDPILEPIGLGLANSIVRYHAVRDRYPDAAMMMGIGNITELTDADSAGINLLLLGVCQELRIESVLTTEVINWARSSVRECAIARRLVHYAVQQRVPPKRLDDSLVALRDPRLSEFSEEVLRQMAAEIRDYNYRIHVAEGQIHLMNRDVHLVGTDPFELFAELLQHPTSERLDASHSFYLGFELAKALVAMTLSKQYEQDEALRWGYLTRPEKHHRLTKRQAKE